MAKRQHGVVARAQLLDVGVGERAIGRWQAKGLLHRVHPGVYRLGHRAPSTEAAYLAAVLAGGEGFALCGFAAAHHLGALRKLPAPEITGPVDLDLRGVITHRLAPLAAGDHWVRDGIPVTSPARTLVDLAGTASLDALAEISHHLGIIHRLGAADVHAAMARRGRVNGAPKLRAIYEGDAAVLLGRLERAFIRLVRGAGLPLPQTNRRRGTFYIDCRWPGLTVELLGYRFHGSRHAWTRDQRRQREAYARGDDFRTYTWDDVHDTPGVVIAEVTTVLRAARAA